MWSRYTLPKQAFPLRWAVLAPNRPCQQKLHSNHTIVLQLFPEPAIRLWSRWTLPKHAFPQRVPVAVDASRTSNPAMVAMDPPKAIIPTTLDCAASEGTRHGRTELVLRLWWTHPEQTIKLLAHARGTRVTGTNPIPAVVAVDAARWDETSSTCPLTLICGAHPIPAVHASSGCVPVAVDAPRTSHASQVAMDTPKHGIPTKNWAVRTPFGSPACENPSFEQ